MIQLFLGCRMFDDDDIDILSFPNSTPCTPFHLFLFLLAHNGADDTDSLYFLAFTAVAV